MKYNKTYKYINI